MTEEEKRRIMWKSEQRKAICKMFLACIGLLLFAIGCIVFGVNAEIDLPLWIYYILLLN